MGLPASKINSVVDAGFEQYDNPRFTIVTKEGATTGTWSGHGTDMQTGEEDMWLKTGPERGEETYFSYSEIEHISLQEEPLVH